MIRVGHLFESHLAVSSLDRAIAFYRDVVGLSLAAVFDDRRVAFFWVGGAGQSMLGVWETGYSPQRMSLHIAFSVSLEDLLAAPAHLQNRHIAVLDFECMPTEEPVVLPWMPAASVYFHDPDGNLLEYITMLDEASDPRANVMSWTSWLNRRLRSTEIGTTARLS
jgi:lactoylglutathione lyase